ncbi:MAG: hypothetical protein J1E80_05535 [Desulfovibrionaceae bacterium]|nr:hypothetical protein [Desulfovibrionaceae bacterium]
MKAPSVVYEELLEKVSFLINQEKFDPDTLLNDIQKKIQEIKSKNAIDEIKKTYQNLPLEKQKKFLDKHSSSQEEIIYNKKKENVKIIFNINELYTWETSELVKKKPKKLCIDQYSYDVKHWSELTCLFVKFLITHGDLKKENLPIRFHKTGKAFVNSIPKQPSDANGSDGMFREVADGFYVDVKYNVRYHIMNMVNILKKLSIPQKYNIYIQLS